MSVERRYPEGYPRPHLPIHDLKIRSAIQGDRDYAILGRSYSLGGYGFELRAWQHEHSGFSDTRVPGLGFHLPLERADIEQLIVGLTQLLADYDRQHAPRTERFDDPAEGMPTVAES